MSPVLLWFLCLCCSRPNILWGIHWWILLTIEGTTQCWGERKLGTGGNSVPISVSTLIWQIGKPLNISFHRNIKAECTTVCWNVLCGNTFVLNVSQRKMNQGFKHSLLDCKRLTWAWKVFCTIIWLLMRICQICSIMMQQWKNASGLKRRCGPIETVHILN